GVQHFHQPSKRRAHWRARGSRQFDLIRRTSRFSGSGGILVLELLHQPGQCLVLGFVEGKGIALVACILSTPTCTFPITVILWVSSLGEEGALQIGNLLH